MLKLVSTSFRALGKPDLVPMVLLALYQPAPGQDNQPRSEP